MKILVIAKDGMLGHVVYNYFKEQGHTVEGTSRREKNAFYLDMMENERALENILDGFQPDVVVNCAGILNQVAEENKPLAVKVNSYFPHYVDELSKQYGFKFIHVSTDCVFDGKKGAYSEDSFKDAKSFYGQSKALGEINNDRNLTIRTSIIGPDMNSNGIGLFQWFMKQTGAVNGFSKVIWTGVTTIQLAKCIEEAINANITGLYHAVNGDTIDKYSLLNLFKTYFDKDIEINKDTTYVSDKTLVKEKHDFEFSIPTYEDMIKDMYDWIMNHEELYPEMMKGRQKK